MNKTTAEQKIAVRHAWLSTPIGREYKRQASLRRNRRVRGCPVPTRPMPEFCEGGCGRRAHSLDHDHETGAFRGWLCQNCNRSLGQFGDSLEGVMRIVSYLKRSMQ